MAFSGEIENVWEEAKAREAGAVSLSATDLQAIISSRIRKEFKTVGQFVWAAIVYQTILYSFLAHTVIREWGDTRIMLFCFAGLALYIPLTIALVDRARALFGRPLEGSPDIVHRVQGEYARLADFFRFKKRMDWIGVPVSCAIIVLVTFTLFVKGGVAGNLSAGVVLFALWVGVSVVAIHAENRKRFLSPLRHLEGVLEDLRNS
jgi:hypothetical protein